MTVSPVLIYDERRAAMIDSEGTRKLRVKNGQKRSQMTAEP
jgi:hypothetical protein